MPINNSRSARAYRRGEALKRRLNDLSTWRGKKDPFIRNGKFIDPEKKAEIAEVDIANLQTKLQSRMITHEGGQTEIRPLDAFTARNSQEVTQAMIDEMDFA